MKFRTDSKLLSEARGMAARKPGEIYVDANDVEYEIIGIRLFPVGGNDEKFDTAEELEAAVNQYMEENPDDVTEVEEANSIKTITKAGIMVLMRNVDTNVVDGYIKYFTDVTNAGFGKWSTTKFTLDTGLKPGSGAAMAEALAIKPSDLIADEGVRTVSEVRSTVLSNAQSLLDAGKIGQDVFEHLTLVFNAAAVGGESPWLVGGGKYASAYNKYLSEILAPMSLSTGWLSTGDRTSSEIVLLNDKETYATMGIRFFQSLTQALIDSELAGDTTSVGISSKAGGGAATSIKSLNSVLENIPEEKLEGIRKHFETPMRIIDIINEKPAIEGVLITAAELDLITKDDALYVARLIKDKVNLEDFKHMDVPENLLNLSRNLGKQSPMDYELKDIQPNYLPGRHILAGVAKEVAKEINSTDLFNQAVRAILNNSSVVQISSKIAVKGEDARFSEFKVIYPPKFQGKIIADASKNFFAGGVKGKLSFKLKVSK